MKPADWKMMGYIGLVLGILFLIGGGWIWLNVQGYLGWGGEYEYYAYRYYPMPLLIAGVILFVVGYAFVWRGVEEEKSQKSQT